MRHLINFGLLFSFIALAVTGGLAFARPFSLTVTQIHIVAGALVLLLVIGHLSGRLPYFKKAKIGRGRVVSLALGIGAVVALAALSLPPSSWLVQQSYESRQRAHIVRTSSLTGFGEISDTRQLISRQPNDPSSSSGLSLLIQLSEGLETLPAIAVWAESSAGTMIETLHLQQSLAYSDKPLWEDVRTPRHHILPLWRHRYTAVSKIRPDGKVDTMSGSTETHSYALDPYLVPGEGQKFILCVEINLPKDPNETFSDPQIGQPSLLYAGYIKVDDEQPYSILELTGHGGGSAEDSGNIQYDLEGFTSAKQIVDLLLVKLERP